MREEKETGTDVVDVDGSYLHVKQRSKGMADIDNVTLPDVPLIGWESINVVKTSDGVPKVTHSKVLNRYSTA